MKQTFGFRVKATGKVDVAQGKNQGISSRLKCGTLLRFSQELICSYL